MTTLKAINIASYLTLAIAFCLVVYVSYSLWWPVEVYKPGEVTTDKLEYYPGDQIYVSDTRCKLKPYPATVSLALINDIIYQFPLEERNAPVGCDTIIGVPRNIPLYAEPGEYHAQLVLRFHVNALRDEVYTMESNHFKVLPLPEEGL